MMTRYVVLLVAFLLMLVVFVIGLGLDQTAVAVDRQSRA